MKLGQGSAKLRGYITVEEGGLLFFQYLLQAICLDINLETSIRELLFYNMNRNRKKVSSQVIFYANVGKMGH